MLLGINLPNYGELGRREAMIAVGDATEALGFASLWTTDHILMPASMPDPYGNILESITTLSFIAGRTERITLGTSVIVLPQREPVLLAKQAATLHHLSNGRFVLGVGIGWVEAEYGYLAADYSRRGRNADEFIRLMRELWSADEVTFHGDVVTIDHALFSPANRDLGPIPIVVGGGSLPILKRVASLADGWHAYDCTFSEFTASVVTLRSLTDRPLDLSLRIRVSLDGRIDEPDADERFLMGSAQRIIDSIHRWGDGGVAHLVLDFEARELSPLLEGMQRFAEEILPHVREPYPAPGQ